jgi:hypothetical protein
MGNIIEFFSSPQPNIDLAYDALIKSKHVLPDKILYGMVEKVQKEAKNQEQELVFLPMLSKNHDYSRWNQIAVGNCLAIKRAFPQNGTYNLVCSDCLKGWLRYIGRDQQKWHNFTQSNELMYILALIQ